MKINSDAKDNRVTLDGNGTMILHKNKYGIYLDAIKEDSPKLTIKNMQLNGNFSGNLKQLLAATEWIYGLNYSIQRRTKKIANITMATAGVTSLVSLYILNRKNLKRGK